MQENSGLVFVGQLIDVQPVPDAHFIVSATVVCGKGGKWRGVIRKYELDLGSKCIVYLPDSLLPVSEEMQFMENRGWRVRMCRFRGAPSEVLIMPMSKEHHVTWTLPVGTDVTHIYGVKKYVKPVPAHLQGLAKGNFPDFIPKTDELNYQRHFDLVETLNGKPFYTTVKMDGSSTTAYKYKGQFGVCSRNLELIEDDKNGYWKIANKYKLPEKLPEGYALQWETCGPKIQSNPMGLNDIEGYAFSAYDIPNHKYVEMGDLIDLCKSLQFPMCDILSMGQEFNKDGIELMGEGKYDNGKQREGIVVRSQENVGHAPISFKVINLNYEK